MSCHGGPDGGIQIGKNEGKVYGATLRNKLSRYKGKFVIMLDCCHAGVIIGRDADGQEENVTNTQVLDNFVNSFKEDNMPRAGELAEPKYMVLASCSGRQKSYTISGNGEATGAWLNGAGWNTSTALSDVQRADKNGNKKITLQELYSYSRDAVWASVGDDPEKGQEVVVYPSNCDFNIFVR